MVEIDAGKDPYHMMVNLVLTTITRSWRYWRWKRRIRGSLHHGYLQSRFLILVLLRLSGYSYLGVTCKDLNLSSRKMVHFLERYRLLRSYHAQTQYWKDFDPFLKQKNKAFKDSSNSIVRKSGVLNMFVPNISHSARACNEHARNGKRERYNKV